MAQTHRAFRILLRLALYLLTYIALYANFNVNAMINDIAQRHFITMGVLAWLLPSRWQPRLSIRAIRKMGGKLMEAAAPIGVRGRGVRGDSLLVAGQARCARPDEHYDHSGGSAGGAAGD